MSLIAPLLLSLAVVRPADVSNSCAGPSLLPAYSHNDYRNAHPLHDALDLGYRGVEADLFRVDETLLVGHDRDELHATMTFARAYLEPLQDRLRRCGYVLADSTSFLLNVELKERDEIVFQLLLDELGRYPELFYPLASDIPSPVRVALVGWWPSLDENQRRWPEYLGVQLVVGNAADTTGVSIALVSIDYGKKLTWNGRGRVPRKAEAVVVEARRLAASLGVPLRVHHTPKKRRVYEWLLSEGVTFIGTTDLVRTRELLDALSTPATPAPDPTSRRRP